MIPTFSTALANSSGSTVPLLLRSKYLKALRRTVSSFWTPVAFWANLVLSVFSKLHKRDGGLGANNDTNEDRQVVSPIAVEMVQA